VSAIALRLLRPVLVVTLLVATAFSIQAATGKSGGKHSGRAPVFRGCVMDNDTGHDACGLSADGLHNAIDVTISEDGRFLYTVGRGDSAITTFNRDPGTGAIAPVSCVDDNDTGPDSCAQTTDGMDGTFYMELSPDGRFAYASSNGDSAIVSFARNTQTGALTPLGCVDDNDTGPDNCAQSVDGLDVTESFVISPDGTSLYAPGLGDDAIAMFRRNPATGALTPQGCIDDNDTGPENCAQTADGLDAVYFLEVSPDGRWLYTASTGDSAVAIFQRDPATGGLTPRGCVDDVERGADTCAQSVEGLGGARSLKLEGRFLYVAGREDDSLVTFQRNPLTGALRFKGCVDDNDTGPDRCRRTSNGLDTPRSIDITEDGRSLYVAATDDDSLVRFHRNPRTGAVVPAGCIDDNDSGVDRCARSADGMDDPYYIELSEDGRTGYVAAHGDDSVAIFSRTTLGREGKRHRKG
jgi:6-phosphogluconolactonase (cycloisomerase 2 family)